ncbi:MAG: toll/interleukin-1 receptor domain-containing protein [Betaproteobacteria bacterium]|nr:toll/interleukin-1 receptor domain-containing protein [Betaproteobacteria bacterium]
MKVFVSWSGGLSHSVAKILKDWLPNVIQAIDVFLSSEDIAKGSQWFHELGSVLDESVFGILCLTQENLSAPWILYEAGALSKRFEQARIVPLLIDLKTSDLAGPLAQFNAALLSKEEIAKLVTAINAQLGPKQLTEKQLDKAFQTWWPELEKSLQQVVNKARSSPGKFTYDIFLSTPMAAYSSDAEYQADRAQYKKLFDSLKQGCGLSVYWAAEKIESMSDFDALDVSVLDDLKALPQSRYFVLIYPRKLASSVLFEAGYALAINRFSHYFVRDHNDLPFLMGELPGSNPNVRIHTAHDWKNYDDLAEKMKKYKDKWFGM